MCVCVCNVRRTLENQRQKFELMKKPKSTSWGGPEKHSIKFCMYTLATDLHACMYVCIYICMHECIYFCIHSVKFCMYTLATDLQACMFVCVYACMHICMYACIMRMFRLQSATDKHAYTHAYTRIHKNTHTHAHNLVASASCMPLGCKVSWSSSTMSNPKIYRLTRIHTHTHTPW